MKKIFLVSLILLVVVPAGFLIWMNLTPGYFQYGPCGCGVGYYTDEEISSIGVKCMTMCYVSRPGRFLNDFLLLASRLDFNRGRTETLSIRDYVCPKAEWVNCMPILTPEAQKSCTKEYLDWAKNNCPGFKGGAM